MVIVLAKYSLGWLFIKRYVIFQPNLDRDDKQFLALSLLACFKP